MPHDIGIPVQTGASGAEPWLTAAKVESFLEIREEPQCGHGVPSHLLDLTKSSLSF